MLSNRKNAGIIVFLFIISVLAIYLYSYNSPTDSRLFPQCPFKLLTGWNCPGCGIQRAMHSLLNGRWSEALSYNYFFIISIPYTVLICIAYVMRKINIGKNMTELFEHRTLVIGYVCCFMAWFIIRNILGI